MRNLDPAFSAALEQQNVGWAVLVELTFKSQTRFVWSGSGDLTVTLPIGGIPQPRTYEGTGDLGQIGAIEEGSEGKAEGTSVALSGVSPLDLAEAMTDVQQGAPARILLVLLDANMVQIGMPYVWFDGLVDGAPVAVGAEEMKISITLETELANHERANNLKWTSADQRLLHPDDTAFFHVERLNDQALRWGS